ncbi:MAG: stationary phase survival protein SurE, partial [Tissierellales bacterium]
AIEANLYNIPSIALSAQWDNGNINYDLAVKYGKYILEKLKDRLLENNMILSINTPFIKEEQVKGIKVCKIGGVVYDYYVMEDGQIKGESVLKADGRMRDIQEEDTDRYYISQGYVTITPLQYNLTNFQLIDKVQDWI